MLDIQYFLVPEWILLWGSRISIVKMVRLMYGALHVYICIRCVPPHHSKFDYILTISTMMPTTMMQSSSASNLFDIVPMFYLLVPSYNLTPIRYVYIYILYSSIYLPHQSDNWPRLFFRRLHVRPRLGPPSRSTWRPWRTATIGKWCGKDSWGFP